MFERPIGVTAEVYNYLMAEDLLSVLTRFHSEVVLPDIERIVDTRITPLRQEMLSHFDAIYRRFDRLESEYAALKVGLQRVEERLNTVDQKLDRMALRSELLDLKGRVVALEQRIAELEANL
jgi:chromosome segregation ATPase